MHAGTTSDVFLRENLEWLGMATNWAKFSATAALGVIHKGYFQEGMNILGPYLPQNGAESQIQGAAYSEGGALYALGLINAGCGSGQTVENYLRETLKNAQGEIVQHGAALGLGVAGMGGRSSDAYDDLKETLFTDSAVAGEAAGYAMGLVMLGSASQTCAEEMITYARETQHEKIIRGLAMALAFVFYGRQEEADETIRLLLVEKVDNFSFFSDISFPTHLYRTPSCVTAVFTPSLSLTPERQTTMPFVNCYTLLYQIRQTTCEERPSRHLRFFFSRILVKYPG